MACTSYFDCDNKNESLESLLKRMIVEKEDGTLALRVSCCESTPEPPPVELPFRMLIDTKANADTMIGGDSASVADWNTFFGAGNMGTPFDNIALTNLPTGCQIDLFGGANVKLRDYLFGDNDPNGTSLLEVDDQLECVIECKKGVFSDWNTGSGCKELVSINFPACVTLGDEVFNNCIKLAYLDLPFDSYTSLGNSTFAWLKAHTSPLTFSNVITLNGGCFDSFAGSQLNLPILTTAGLGEFNKLSATSISFPELVSIGNIGFSNCLSSTISLPNLLSCGDACFENCGLLTTLDLSSCTNLGSTAGNDGVFTGITGNTITITIPHALEADGDIVWLKANNTVTVLYSD